MRAVLDAASQFPPAARQQVSVNAIGRQSGLVLRPRRAVSIAPDSSSANRRASARRLNHTGFCPRDLVEIPRTPAHQVPCGVVTGVASNSNGIMSEQFRLYRAGDAFDDRVVDRKELRFADAILLRPNGRSACRVDELRG